MKKISLVISLISLVLAQEALTNENPIEDQITAEIDSIVLDTTVMKENSISQKMDSTISLFSVPAGLEFGYKGIEWGSSQDSPLKPQLQNSEMGSPLIYLGKLGSDSVKVLFFFADSGFWKAEINFELDQQDPDQEIKFFLRLEKSISDVYGPALKTTQIQSGPGPSYTNSIFPKFSRSFYRSTWYSAPVMIELLLNSLVLLPASDLPVFDGDFSILKLVYYNPDYQISSEPGSEPQVNPSIFDIY
ncbi:MAG: hypothetical protein V3S48_08145 [Candidatus Neomarinimicrobiota bacterium]